MVRQAPVICVMAPPIHLGAWSMALMLWLPFVFKYCFSTVLVLFKYCFSTVLVLFKYCFSTVLVLFKYCRGTVLFFNFLMTGTVYVPCP